MDISKKAMVVLFCLILVSASVFVYADNFTATAVWGYDTVTPVVTDSGKSIAHYLKIINANIVNQVAPVNPNITFINSSDAEKKRIDAEEKAKVSADAKGAKGSTSVTQGSLDMKTVQWTNILSDQTATIVFPNLTVNGQSHSLKVIAHSRNGIGLRFIEVYDNGAQQSCNSGFWRGLWNGFGLADSIVLGWGQGNDYCSASVGGYHILDASISGDTMQTITLTSPIIPKTCADTISQTSGTNAGNIKQVTC